MNLEELLAKYGYGMPRSPSEVGDGWLPLVEEALLEMKKRGVPEIRQIKEKFGALRIYVTPPPDAVEGVGEDVYDVLHKLEIRSRSVCEDCGVLGSKRVIGGAWIRTLCGPCEEIAQNRK